MAKLRRHKGKREKCVIRGQKGGAGDGKTHGGWVKGWRMEVE